MVSSLELIPLLGLPMVEPGDDIARLIADGISANGLSLVEGDVVVIAQKIISKAEDRYRLLSEVVVSKRAQELAEQAQKDPRLVQRLQAGLTGAG